MIVKCSNTACGNYDVEIDVALIDDPGWIGVVCGGVTPFGTCGASLFTPGADEAAPSP